MMKYLEMKLIKGFIKNIRGILSPLQLLLFLDLMNSISFSTDLVSSKLNKATKNNKKKKIKTLLNLNITIMNSILVILENNPSRNDIDYNWWITNNNKCQNHIQQTNKQYKKN